MRPKKQENPPQDELFQVRLETICNPANALVRLADQMDWDHLDEQFSSLFSSEGRPAIPTRMMVGLTLLQSLYSLSEDDVVNRWAENPYWQYLCGETFFQHRPPIARSGLSKWRKRIKSKGMEALLQQTLAVGLSVGVVKASSLKRVSVDTTVQPKAITHPTDSKLLNRSREHLVKLAKAQGISLRQSYQRKGPQATLKAGRYAHAKQFKRMRKSIKTLKTYLGRVVRDIERKTDIVATELKDALTQAKRLLSQNPRDSHKLYSLHEPHVACISKGKAHKKYEFGNKVSVCVTNKEGFIVGTQGLEGNPYDGHTLKGALDQVTELTGIRPKRCYVDRGYRGHGVTDTDVFISGQRRNIAPAIKKELKRRSAIEAVIGHQKTEGRLGRNLLRGLLGDKVNALMAAIGYNLRLILKALSCWLQILKELFGSLAGCHYQSLSLAV
ncbi:IS5 family transposase [uncultured Desulfuromonas sp.]|uniref:IS5 family transposase n=1 Tax=uncultured Desulfuromonas sp. TaxID=181013 RepID=UPI002AAC138D|nr:IS5 family transposase [uncultured Desulfuromonas sp.]